MPVLNKLDSNFNLSLLLSTRMNLVKAVAFGLTAFVLLILTYYQLTGISETRKKMEVTQKKTDQLANKIAELEALKTTPEYAQAQKMNDILPSHKPLLELLNNLNSVASETNVSITEFKINPGEIITEGEEAQKVSVKKKKAGDYDQLNLDLSIVGGLDQVKEFMTLIERVSPITTITSLTIDRKATNIGDNQQLTRADLSLSTYYYTKSVSATLSAAIPSITQEERAIFQDIIDFSPSQIENQVEIIGGNNTDLFGIDGLNVGDLEQQIEDELTFTE
ncbi:MAG: type 4a pilus biogenesis protein PilO [Patescibacteria group bacterium]